MTSITTSASPTEAPAPQQSALEAAQQRLVQAAMAQPMHPLNAALSAYANGILYSARMDAVCEVLTGTEPITRELLDAAILRALERKTQQVQAESRRLQLAQASGPIIVKPS